jgi:predicted transcriptional regulator
MSILSLLLKGPATYQELKTATKAKAGPLYFHVQQLRLAGLIDPSERNVYQVTSLGLAVVGTVMALGIVQWQVRKSGGS